MACVFQPTKVMNGRAFQALVVVALTLAGVYLARATPVVAAAVVVMALLALWLFWFAWLEYSERHGPH